MKRCKRTLVLCLMLVVCFVVSTASLHAKGKNEMTGVVNINTANLAELTMLPGVGPSKARAIIEHRASTPFKSPAEKIPKSPTI